MSEQHGFFSQLFIPAAHVEGALFMPCVGGIAGVLVVASILLLSSLSTPPLTPVGSWLARKGFWGYVQFLGVVWALVWRMYKWARLSIAPVRVGPARKAPRVLRSQVVVAAGILNVHSNAGKPELLALEAHPSERAVEAYRLDVQVARGVTMAEIQPGETGTAFLEVLPYERIFLVGFLPASTLGSLEYAELRKQIESLPPSEVPVSHDDHVTAGQLFLSLAIVVVMLCLAFKYG